MRIRIQFAREILHSYLYTPGKIEVQSFYLVFLYDVCKKYGLNIEPF
jgi:hypothetical protein